jgi:hypothetical protein
LSAAAKKRDPESELQEHIARFVYDPYGFVLFAFPWGEPGPLVDETGPDEWQEKVLKRIGEELKRNDLDGAIRIAAGSGHGIGKTCLIAWIIIWFMSTRPNPQLPVTANTSDQLSQKTWRELAKWHKLAINSHWFQWTATKFYHVDFASTWFASAVPWSKERSEAFAGTHEKYVMMLFDEASAIEDIIWEVAEGAMTTPGAIWIVFGNRTKNTGRFHECFNKWRHRWITYEIDSRTSKKADKKQIEQWAKDYGEDSDFFKVRVKGQAPRTGFRQFISSDAVEKAAGREIAVDSYRHAPIIIGVDVSDFGEDMSVIYIRQGLATLEIQKHRPRTMDQQWTMTFASLIAQEIVKYKPDGVMVDSTGLGLGVADRLIQLGYSDIVYKVYSGSSPLNDKEYFNKRVEMWGLMRDWLQDGCIPDDQQLKDDLTGPEYGFSNKEQFQLEKKSDMKSRGLASPDCGDALSMTFAFQVSKRKPQNIVYKKPWDPWAVLQDQRSI